MSVISLATSAAAPITKVAKVRKPKASKVASHAQINLDAVRNAAFQEGFSAKGSLAALVTAGFDSAGIKGAFMIGYIAGRLAKSANDAQSVLEARAAVILAKPGKDSQDANRRTVQEHNAWNAAKTAWQKHAPKKAKDETKSTRGGKRDKNAKAGDTGKGETSKVVAAPPAKTADDATAYLTQQFVMLLAYVNKNAGVVVTSHAEAIIAAHKVIVLAKAE